MDDYIGSDFAKLTVEGLNGASPDIKELWNAIAELESKLGFIPPDLIIEFNVASTLSCLRAKGATGSRKNRDLAILTLDNHLSNLPAAYRRKLIGNLFDTLGTLPSQPVGPGVRDLGDVVENIVKKTRHKLKRSHYDAANIGV